jgi:hypothetical protein
VDAAALVEVLIVAVLVMGGCAVAAALVRSVRRRRTERARWAGLAGWARDTGWSFRSAAPDRGYGRFKGWLPPSNPLNDVHERFRGWPFNRDWGLGARRTQVVVAGRYGDHQALAFEFVHVAPTIARYSRPAETHYRIAVLVLPAAGPSLEVKRRRRDGKAIELDSAVEGLLVEQRFAATFSVWTDDAEFAGRVLTPELMTWLLSAPGSAPLSFRFEGEYLLCWQRGTLDAGWVVTALKYLEALLGLAVRAA